MTPKFQGPEHSKTTFLRSCYYGSLLTNPTRIHEDADSIPASLSGLRIHGCHELWRRLQTQLRSCQWGRSSDLTPNLGTSICCGCSLKKTKNQKKKKSGSYSYHRPMWFGGDRMGSASGSHSRTQDPPANLGFHPSLILKVFHSASGVGRGQRTAYEFIDQAGARCT